MPTTTRAILRVSRDRKRLTVLCPIGHLITAYELDSSFGGSYLEGQWSQHQAGVETHWDRQAATCQGHGH